MKCFGGKNQRKKQYFSSFFKLGAGISIYSCYTLKVNIFHALL